jgi:NAD(P)-dependent dehydrogenase (short-subunit alcohol dehydrogenase family)
VINVASFVALVGAATSQIAYTASYVTGTTFPVDGGLTAAYVTPE